MSVPKRKISKGWMWKPTISHLHSEIDSETDSRAPVSEKRVKKIRFIVRRKDLNSELSI